MAYDEGPAYDDDNASKECPVCMDEIHPVSECRLRCGHSMCSQCITQLRRGLCPVCRNAIFPEDAPLTRDAVGGGGHAPPDLAGSSHRQRPRQRSHPPPTQLPTVRTRPVHPPSRTAISERTAASFGHPGGVCGSLQAAGGHMHFSAF